MKTKNKPTEEELIGDHLETYSPILDEINKAEVYEPSLLFSWRERLQKYIYKIDDSDIYDGEEQLKELMKYGWYFVGVFVIVTLVLVSL
jgi:hypothetical protein